MLVRRALGAGAVLSLGQLDLHLAAPFITRLRTQLGGKPLTVGMVDAQGKFIGRPSSLVLNGGH